MLPLILVALIGRGSQVDSFKAVGTWKSHAKLVESAFESSTPDSIKSQMRQSVRDMNAKPWSISLRRDHTYSLPGEQGKWSIAQQHLLLTAVRQGGRALTTPKRQAYEIGASGTRFGLRLSKFIRIDFTRSQKAR